MSSVDYEKYKINGELPHWAQLLQQVEHYLLPALKYADTHNLQDVADEIEAGNMMLWAGEKSAIVTEIQDFPRKKVLLVFIAGGDIKEMEYISPHIVKFAQDMGCQRIILTGRRGWSRTFLTNMAFKPTHYWMSKEL